MSIVNTIKSHVTAALSALYNHPYTEKDFQINQTKPEFEGDYTIVMFSLVKSLKTSPEVIGDALGAYLVQHHPDLFSDFNIIKAFLNLAIPDSFWSNLLQVEQRIIKFVLRWIIYRTIWNFFNPIQL